MNETDVDEIFNFNKIEEKIIRKVFEWPKIVESFKKL